MYLLNLKNRYANPQIYNYLLNLGNSLYSDIIQYENNLGKKLTDSELNNYITTAKKHDKKHIPLYFVQILLERYAYSEIGGTFILV